MEKFHGFPYSLQADSQIVPPVGYNSLPIISISPLILPFSALWSEYIQTALESKQPRNKLEF